MLGSLLFDPRGPSPFHSFPFSLAFPLSLYSSCSPPFLLSLVLSPFHLSFLWLCALLQRAGGNWLARAMHACKSREREREQYAPGWVVSLVFSPFLSLPSHDIVPFFLAPLPLSSFTPSPAFHFSTSFLVLSPLLSFLLCFLLSHFWFELS